VLGESITLASAAANGIVGALVSEIDFDVTLSAVSATSQVGALGIFDTIYLGGISGTGVAGIIPISDAVIQFYGYLVCASIGLVPEVIGTPNLSADLMATLALLSTVDASPTMTTEVNGTPAMVGC
jgi:hypothetical protein